MNHVGIDLGSRTSQICVCGPDGSVSKEYRVPTRELPKLIASLSHSRVVVETSAEAFRIVDVAKAAGHEVRAVPATIVRLLGVGERGVKNDRRDAQRLSLASWRTDLPSVHIPSLEARNLKSVCGTRDILVAQQRNLSNNVRGWMRTQLWKIQPGKMKTLPERLRAHAEQLGTKLPEHIERGLQSLAQTTAHVEDATKQVEQIAKAHPVCQRLMTVPGVGPITSVRFVAAIDDVNRFPTSHRVQSYLGLTPGEHSSGNTTRKTGITKAGQVALRRCLVQGAWAALNTRSEHRMLSWARRLAERRNPAVAATALARKLAGIMFRIWRDGTTYDPKRAAAEVLR